MSKIPFPFDHKPQYFRKNGWLKNLKTRAFIDWCFERCSSCERDIQHDNQRIKLKPYQFIFGRKICSEETGLTENEVRTQQLSMENAGFLKKSTNKTPSRFTIYEWSTEVFCENNHQVNNQATTKSPPSHHHKQELRTIEEKQLPAGGEVFSCLSVFTEQEIPLEKKIWLSKEYDEQTIQIATKYIRHPSTNIKTTILQCFVWACKNKPEPTPSKEENSQVNELFAKELQKIDQPYRIEACREYLEIVKSQCSPSIILNYTMSPHEFKKKCFENSLCVNPIEKKAS